ncbi:MAG: RsmE family RNA methyltransferase, partial [Actinomycetota bacterium]
MTSQRHAPYFFVDAGDLANGEVRLRPEDAKHLAVVRRARPGDQIWASDGAGTVVSAELVAVGPEGVEARIVRRDIVGRPFPRIVVFQAASRGHKIDLAVGKLTELGVEEVVIFASARSVPTWDHAKGTELLKRWTKVAFEAAKQSRRAWLPEVGGPLPIEKVASAASGLTIVADAAAPVGLREALGRDNRSDVTIVVGPEGGLAPGEIELFCRHGAIAARLGEGILRTE